MITIKESRLEDSSRKSAHAQRTGYDYNKEVQKHIQALVEIEIESYASTPREKTIKVLLPQPGYYNQKVIIKEEDIVAYSESHPQVAAPPSLRRGIIEKLKSGSTHKVNKSKNSSKKEKKESIRIRLVDGGSNTVILEQSFLSKKEYNKWFEENVVSQGNIISNSKSSSVDFDYDIVVGSQFQEIVNNFSNPIVKESKDANLLTLSLDTIYPEPSSDMTHECIRSTFARASFKPSGIVGNIKQSSKVRILQGHVHNGSWAIADSEEYPDYGLFFISRDDIKILSEVEEHPKKLSDDKSLPSEFAVPLEWTRQSYDIPYYDPSDAKYKVNVLTSYTSFQSGMQTILSEAFYKGAKILLSNLGKTSTDDKIEEIKNSNYYDSAIRAVDTYVDSRPNSFISVLVESPYMNIIKMPDDGGRTVSYYCEDYDTKTFISQLNQVIDKMDKIANFIEKYDGEVLNFEPQKEKENLSHIAGTINKLFRTNGANYDILGSKGFLTLKWSPSFRLVGAEYEDEAAENKITVTKSLNEYFSKPHIESQRTQFIVFSLYKIISEGLDKEWTQFVEDYITFDDVQIVSKKETINRDIFIDEKEAGDIKTLSELNIETNFYSNPERKMQKLEQRKLQSSFTGAAILDMQNVESIKSKIDLDPKEAYNKFLNNVDFRKIVLNSVKSLISEKVDSATDEILKETKKIEDDINNYKTRVEEGIKTGRRIKEELENLVDTATNYLRFGDVYIPKLDRNLQKLEIKTGQLIHQQFDNQGIDVNSLSFYKKNIKSLSEPTFENASSIDIVKDMSSPLQEDIITDVATYSISEGAIQALSNTGGLDDATFNILEQNSRDLISKKSLDFKKVTHFPQTKFKDSLPTDDISQAFFEELLNATSSAINELIKSLINTALDAAFSSNKQQEPSRGYSSDFSSPSSASLDKEASKPLIENMFGKKASPETVQEILDDVGNLLSPKEFCALMDGEPTESSLRVIRATLKATHPELSLDTVSKIRYFFSMLSSYSNYDECDDILEEIPEYLTDDFLCPPNSTLREAILKDKGMTDAQIKKQVEKERQRSKKQAEKLLDHLKDGLLSGNSEAPNDFCVKDSNGKSVPGSSSFMDDNFRYTLSSTVSKTFEPIYNSFRDDSATFISSLFENDGGIRKPLPNLIDAYRSNRTVGYNSDAKQINLNFPKTRVNIEVSESEEPEAQGDAEALEDLMSIYEDIPQDDSLIRITEGTIGEDIRFTISTPSGLFFVDKEIEDFHKTFLEHSTVDTPVTTLKFMEEILMKSYKEAGASSSVIQSVINKAQKVQENLRSKLFSKIFTEIEKSPYLKNIGNISEEEDQPSEPDYILDYVNLCPPPTPSCDPHILGVRSEVDKIYNEFKNDMCADPATGTENPEKTPLEGSLMSSCIKLILRHYIVETMVKGILSLSSTQGRSALDNITLSYIYNSMRISMKSYREQYYEDFVSEVKEVYQGQETTEAKIIKDMINQEYQGISDTLFEVLYLGNKTIDLKSDIVNSIPITELDADKGQLQSVNQFSEFTSPLIIIGEAIDAQNFKATLCLAVDEDITPQVNTNDNFYKAVFLGPDIKDHYLIPIDSKTFEGGVKNEQIIEHFRELKIIDIVLDMCISVDILSSSVFIHEMETASRNSDIQSSYGNTRDNLFSIFYSIMPMKDDWKKESTALGDIAAMTGMSGGAALTGLWDFNFGVFDTPVTENTFNYGLPLSWGNSFKGLFFSFAQKAIKEAALKTLKNTIESSDPNIIYSKKIADYAKLAGKNISTTKISALASLINPLLYPQTPGSLTYHALGLGSYTSSKSSNGDMSQEKANKIQSAGLKLPEFCEEILLD